MIEVFETNSPEETDALGRKLSESATPGQVFTLIGDLGVGKTVFTQGFATGLQIDEAICSPTFTIVHVYRIGDVEEMDEIGYEDYIYGDGVSLIEWANLIEDILPEHYTQITIEKDLEKGFDYRKITVEEK